jgi:hypothetical protein
VRVAMLNLHGRSRQRSDHGRCCISSSVLEQAQLASPDTMARPT